MKSIIDWLLGFNKGESREAATSRMKLMVIHDRSQLPPETLAKMKRELLEVMSKYLEVDPNEAECLIESRDRVASIVTNVPLKARGLEEEVPAQAFERMHLCMLKSL